MRNFTVGILSRFYTSEVTDGADQKVLQNHALVSVLHTCIHAATDYESTSCRVAIDRGKAFFFTITCAGITSKRDSSRRKTFATLPESVEVVSSA